MGEEHFIQETHYGSSEHTPAKEESKPKKLSRKERKLKEKEEKRRQEILRNPTELQKHQYEFTTEEVEKALKRFDLDRQLSQSSREQLDRANKWIGVALNYADTAYRTYSTINKFANIGKELPKKDDKDKKKKG